MKFITVHLKINKNKFAINPLQISALKPLTEGGTRIYYTLLSQHDDIIEEYDYILIQINDTLEEN